MTPMQVALRNVTRNRRRSMATALTVAVGVSALLLFGGYRADLINYMLTQFSRLMGHVLVQHVDYHDYGSGNPSVYSFKNAYAIRDTLQADPQLAPLINVATPNVTFPAVAGNAQRETSKTVFVQGLVAADQARMRDWNHYKIDLPVPEYPLLINGQDSAILGVGAARMMQFCNVLPQMQNCGASHLASSQKANADDEIHGDLLNLADLEQASRAADLARAGPSIDPENAIELLAATTQGVPNVRTFEVVAAEPQGLKEMDDAYVVIDYERARSLLFGQDSTQASSIVLQLHNPADRPAVKARVQRLLNQHFPDQPLVARDISEVAPFMDQTIDMFNMIFGFISVLIFAVVMFTVANTIRAIIVERTAEIGTIRALGFRRKAVLRLFLIEAGLLALAGAVLGAALAISISLAVNAMGLSWMPPNSAERIPLTVSVVNQYVTLLMAALGAVVFATLAAIPAAWKAARLNIVDALRHT